MEYHQLVNHIITLQQESLDPWKANGIKLSNQGLLRIVEENHAFNFQLWHAEDRARRDDMGFEYVYRAKRDIDNYNQQRNNRMEAMDSWFYEQYKPADPTTCPVHSETPGMIIDRLSILALKAYHMHQQTLRTEVTPEHIATCQNKLQTLNAQHQQLTQCFTSLLEDIVQKTRTFKIYHQFKMYNDPHLNPELYRHSQAK